MPRKLTDTILPTTMIGSYPKPRWFEEYNVAGADLLEWWKIEKHFQAYRDATAACIKDQEIAGLDQDAVDWLRGRRPKIFGVDSPSPDNPADRIYPAHLFSRASGVTHYENLANLAEVAGRRFMFFGFPLRIRGGHGSPVRAVAMLDD